jgi:hypothetical protein
VARRSPAASRDRINELARPLGLVLEDALSGAEVEIEERLRDLGDVG